MKPEFDGQYFENLYAEHADPWNYADSPYEAQKYAATIGVLPRATYRRGLELGCSIGVLTARLARLCDALTAVDISERALTIAMQRCADSRVTFVHAHLPDGEWNAPFDLLVLSEILYYLEPDAIDRLASRLTHQADRGADVVLAHWTGETNYPMTADAAVERLRSSMPVSVLEEVRHPEYRLDLWRFH
ncbi:SAM-dependent methyltransferase [Rhodanobacter sp. L36]|uniref:class I SAM-dependent DNA methyltransferase n=1 Tax=Rhodanobacter sp. L36 TaxID=1747221 RepID=UPI001C20164E|nr:SAM-dependent methyltransferase [Rhodanobacter sp. L36]